MAQGGAGEHQRLPAGLSFASQGSFGSFSKGKSRLLPIDKELPFDQGQSLLIRAIQELRARNPKHPVIVGIGGPSGSGKSSLAGRIATVLSGVVVDVCQYCDPRLVRDDVNDLGALDRRLLEQHLKDLVKGRDVKMPLFDSDRKERSGFKLVRVPDSGLVIVKGVFALHQDLQAYLDIRVALVGGVHYNLLQKVKADVEQSGVSMSSEHVMDNVFPTFRTQIEPTLACAQIRISNCFVGDSLRRPHYILKCRTRMTEAAVLSRLQQHPELGNHPWQTSSFECLDVYLCPPGLPPEERKTTAWIRVRQCGIRYFLSVGDQRLVADGGFVIRPRSEFEVGKMTLSGLLQCSYSVAASFSCQSTVLEQAGGRAIVSLDRLKIGDSGELEEFVQVKGVDRDTAAQLAAALGLRDNWITPSYVELVLDKVGVPRAASPPLASSWLRLSGLVTDPDAEEIPTPGAALQADRPRTSSASRPIHSIVQALSSGRSQVHPEAAPASLGEGMGTGPREEAGPLPPRSCAAGVPQAGPAGEQGQGQGQEVLSWTHSPTRSVDAAEMAPASWRLTGLDEAMLMRTQFIQERIAVPAQTGGTSQVLDPGEDTEATEQDREGADTPGGDGTGSQLGSRHSSSAPQATQAQGSQDLGPGTSQAQPGAAPQLDALPGGAPGAPMASSFALAPASSSSWYPPAWGGHPGGAQDPGRAPWHWPGGAPGHGDSSGAPGAGQEAGTGRMRFKLVPKREFFTFDRALVLGIQAAQKLLEHNGPPVIVGVGGPSGSGKSSLARGMAQVMGCQVLSLESYCWPTSSAARPHPGGPRGAACPAISNYDRAAAIDWGLVLKNVEDLRRTGSAQVPVFDMSRHSRIGYRQLTLDPGNGILIVEGSHALHPSLQSLLDLKIAVVGGVHAHLLGRVEQDLGEAASGAGAERGAAPPRQDLERTIFPTFAQEIEPTLGEAHLRVHNDFDPVHSRETSAFVLKSSKEVSEEAIRGILLHSQYTFRQQHLTDIFLRHPGVGGPAPASEGECIRVRMCENRFAILIREPLCEGDFVLQPQVDFDIGVETVAGLLELGYEPMLVLEVTAVLHQDDELLVEVDHLTQLDRRFVQIKGRSKDRVTRAGASLGLTGCYTTQPYLEIVNACSAEGRSLHRASATQRLHQLLEQFSVGLPSQGAPSTQRRSHDGIGTHTQAAPTTDGLQEELLKRLEILDARLARLEMVQWFNTMLIVTFLVYYAFGNAARA